MLRYNLAAAYFWALFYLAFNIAHLIFAFKYWSLSLRIEQIILLQHREYHKKILKLRIAFLTLITMIITASVLLIVEEYLFAIDLNFQSATPVALSA